MFKKTSKNCSIYLAKNCNLISENNHRVNIKNLIRKVSSFVLNHFKIKDDM